MKKLLLAIVAVFGLNMAQAQLPDYAICPEVTFTDLDGNAHDINSYLDSGYSVILDLYAVWCQPCWNYHQEHILDSIQAQYGPNGTNEIRVFGVEADASTAAGTISGGGNSIGDWLTVGYPMVNDDAIAGIFNLAYYPTIVTICPDRSVTESSQVSIAAHYGIAGDCPAVPTESMDASLLDYTGSEIACGTTDMSVILRNLGTSPLTMATIEVFDNGNNVVATENWTGNLDQFDYEEVDLGSVTASPGNYTVKVTDGDPNPSNDEVALSLIDPALASLDINIDVTLDFYGGETSWELRDGGGTIIAEDEYEFGTEDNFGGGGPDALQTHSYTATLGMNDCFTMSLYDSYGDGMSYTGSAGVTLDWGYVISGAAGTILTQDGEFDDEATQAMKTDATSGINEEVAASLKLYPNPTSGLAYIQLNTVDKGVLGVEIVNLLGESVYNENYGVRAAGTQLITFDSNELNNGMYMVRINTGNDMITEMFSVQR